MNKTKIRIFIFKKLTQFFNSPSRSPFRMRKSNVKELTKTGSNYFFIYYEKN